MKLPHHILNTLEKTGWVEFENIFSDDDLIRISSIIGQVTPHPNGELINKLIPNNGLKKIKGTYSNRFGFSEFPLHTDTAFLTIPVRYILLSSIGISSCHTIISPASSILNQLSLDGIKDFERAIFKVKTPANQFYTSLIFREKNIEGIKYDLTCMTPVNKYATFFEEGIKKINPQIHKIKWNGNKAILIDNWRMLHGRENVSVEEDRELKRIYIN